MVEHSNGEESVSRFLIAPILDQDGGEVVCEVSNRYGRDAKTFLLSIEGRNSIFLSEKSVHYHEIYFKCTVLWKKQKLAFDCKIFREIITQFVSILRES